MVLARRPSQLLLHLGDEQIPQKGFISRYSSEDVADSTRERRPFAGRTAGRVLFGLVTLLLVADLVLLTWNVGTGGSESLRLVLALVAIGGVPVTLGVGAVRGTVHPLFALLAVPIAVTYGYSGLVLPWTQLSFWLGQAALEATLSVPVLGEPLTVFLFGGFTLSETTLRTAFRVHYALVAFALFGLLFQVGRALRTRRSGTSAT